MAKKKIRRGASFEKFKALIALAVGSPLGINSEPSWPVCLYTGYISKQIDLEVLEDRWSAVETILKTLKIKYAATLDRKSLPEKPFYGVTLERDAFGKRTLTYLELL